MVIGWEVELCWVGCATNEVVDGLFRRESLEQSHTNLCQQERRGREATTTTTFAKRPTTAIETPNPSTRLIITYCNQSIN